MITANDVIQVLQTADDIQTRTLIEKLIPIAVSDYLSIRNAPFETSDDETIYPDGFDSTLIRMVGYLLNQQSGIGAQSESLGDYSVTYGETRGYPVGVIGQIKRMVSFT